MNASTEMNAPVPAAGAEGDIVGFVEQVSHHEISGWVRSRSGAPIELALRIDDKVQALNPTWTERADVGPSMSGQQDKSGFVVRLLPGEVEPFADRFKGGDAIEILANGVALSKAGALSLDGAPAPRATSLRERARALLAAGGSKKSLTTQMPTPRSPAQSAKAVTGDIVGFIDRLDTEEIAGWVLSRSGVALDMSLRIDNEVRPFSPVWGPRTDVPVAVRGDEETIGFVFRPRGQLVNRLDAAFQRRGNKIEVLANGTSIARAAGCENQPPPRKKPLRRKFTANVESLADFRVSGWCVDSDGQPVDFAILCNGEAIACPIVRNSRLDVSTRIKLANPDVGFEIDLPSQVWQYRDAEGACHLELVAEGQVIQTPKLLLTAAMAAAWVGRVAQLPDGPERQYRTLTAIEHVRAGELFELLDAAASEYIERCAEYLQLEDFLYAGSGVKRKKDEPPRESGSTLLLWDAMRQLNARLGSGDGKVLAHVKHIVEHRRLRGHAREWFLNLAVQLTCGSGEFLQLRELHDFGLLQKFETSSEPHQMTLALPALVADGHLGRATELVWRLSKQLFSGWMHTECIRFSVGLVQQMEAAGEVDALLAERFRTALLAMLAGFSAEWFSRLHDRELVDSLILALLDLDRYTDHHKSDLVAAAIRLYGLNPTFWARWLAQPIRPHHAELVRAEASWKIVAAVLEGPAASIHERFPALVGPMHYFYRQGNPEVSIVLREVLLAGLPGESGLNAGGRELLDLLLSRDRSDAVRIAAYPADRPVELWHELPDTQQELLHLLRRMGDRRRSHGYDLQVSASAAMRRFRETQALSDESGMRQALDDLESRAIALAGSHCASLGADLFANAYLLADDAGLDAERYLMRIVETVRKLCEPTATDPALPVPVQTAIRTLCARPGGGLTRMFADEILGVVRSRFGEQYDELFEEPESPVKLSIAGRGWPQDTLVLIYSCRAHLDTHVQTIRETWLKDLSVAGVPYLIVVGGGDDTVQGDVLALDVGDRYEDTARKTLKLFEWVYRNTDAQFVLKIEDDCYLDVERYFGTLSYRKHAYYGRVVHHKQGMTRRLLQNPKLSALPADSLVDKSPEPSYYADGRVGYCLSRLSLMKLLEAAEEPAGQRLISVSFFEDKLVGDLLASNGVWANDEDSDAYQQRALTPGSVAVAAGDDNTFYPGPMTPAKVVHVGSTGMDVIAKRTEGFFPKKIWPTCWTPSITVNSSQLQLLTPLAHAGRLLQESTMVVGVVRNELTMMPHFLDHYRKLGLRCFILVDNCSNDGTQEYLASQPDVVLYSSDTEYKYSHYGVAWQQAVLGAHCLGKWVVLADADELLVYEDSEQVPLSGLLQSFDEQGANGALTYMIDMYPYGDLDEACFSTGKPFEVAPYFDREPLIELRFGGGMYSNSRNFVNALRHRVAPSRINAYVSQKYAVFKYFPWVRLSEGVHYAANLRVTSTPVFFAHFKYHSGFKKKVTDEIKRNQHFNGAEEYRRYAAMLAEGAGGFGAEGRSVRFESSHSFLELGFLQDKGSMGVSDA